MRIVPMTPCIDHNRTASLVDDSYALVTFKGKARRLHRVVYCRHHKVSIESIDGLLVRHACDNPRCINPEHLLLGSHQDNMDDKVARGRSSNVWQRVLKDEQVLAIRASYVKSRKGVPNPNGYRGLGRKFGVDSNAIRLIVLGVTYKEVV